YKDMLAVQKKGGVIRDYPMIPGIDVSGTIVATEDTSLSTGQEVLVTGFAMGMSHTGGFAEYVRVPKEWIVPVPSGMSLKETMVIGTAGFTAALSILALEHHGMHVDKNPRILVTGATGGVGSLALRMLRKAGYNHITAMVRKEHQEEVARTLGAHDILQAKDVSLTKKPLEKQQYDYILDTVGGEVAAALLPRLAYGGSMSMCGNAAGIDLKMTVLPFILRGVNLIGIDSVNIPLAERQGVWEKLAQEWNITQEALVHEITLQEVPETIKDVKEGNHLGRTIIAF
ncbi:MAG: YhdH/YhfP family quinone oxidoreductase, partial [Exiguobacterium sp.]